MYIFFFGHLIRNSVRDRKKQVARKARKHCLFQGTIFLGGPPLVQAATGERVSAEELGGATLHCMTSGCADHFMTSEEEGLETVRDVIATLNLSSKKKAQTEFYNSQVGNRCRPAGRFVRTRTEKIHFWPKQNYRNQKCSQVRYHETDWR